MSSERVSTEVPRTNGVFTIRILLVESDPIYIEMNTTMLKLFEYEVLVAKTAFEAIATLRMEQTTTPTAHFDLILCDLHMPFMNAVDFRKLVDQEFHIPVILMSSEHKRSSMFKGLVQNGLPYFVDKPPCAEDLLHLKQYLISKKKEIELNNLRQNLLDEDDNDEENRGRNNGAENSKKHKLVWTNELHGKFLEAINQIGYSRAVPKKILEYMNIPGLTRENIASHLQKYRLYLKKICTESGATETVMPKRGWNDSVYRSIMSWPGPFPSTTPNSSPMLYYTNSTNSPMPMPSIYGYGNNANMLNVSGSSVGPFQGLAMPNNIHPVNMLENLSMSSNGVHTGNVFGSGPNLSNMVNPVNMYGTNGSIPYMSNVVHPMNYMFGSTPNVGNVVYPMNYMLGSGPNVSNIAHPMHYMFGNTTTNMSNSALPVNVLGSSNISNSVPPMKIFESSNASNTVKNLGSINLSKSTVNPVNNSEGANGSNALNPVIISDSSNVNNTVRPMTTMSESPNMMNTESGQFAGLTDNTRDQGSELSSLLVNNKSANEGGLLGNTSMEFFYSPRSTTTTATTLDDMMINNGDSEGRAQDLPVLTQTGGDGIGQDKQARLFNVLTNDDMNNGIPAFPRGGIDDNLDLSFVMNGNGNNFSYVNDNNVKDQVVENHFKENDVIMNSDNEMLLENNANYFPATDNGAQQEMVSNGSSSGSAPDKFSLDGMDDFVGFLANYELENLLA